MGPIGAGKFVLGIVVMGVLWLSLKPMMDEVIAIMPGITTMSDTEVVVFQLLIWIIASILLIWLLVKLTKRSQD